MSYTKRRVDYYESNPPAQTILKRLLHLEDKLSDIEQKVNNFLKEKGVR